MAADGAVRNDTAAYHTATGEGSIVVAESAVSERQLAYDAGAIPHGSP